MIAFAAVRYTVYRNMRAPHFTMQRLRVKSTRRCADRCSRNKRCKGKCLWLTYLAVINDLASPKLLNEGKVSKSYFCRSWYMYFDIVVQSCTYHIVFAFQDSTSTAEEGMLETASWRKMSRRLYQSDLWPVLLFQVSFITC